MTNESEQKEEILALLNSYPLEPTGSLKNAHVQTLYQPLLRRNGELELEHHRVSGDDGELLDLYLAEPAGELRESPLVLIAHGLEGNQESPYLRGLQLFLQEKGWGSACLVHRSCGGSLNEKERTYHSGETGDLSAVAHFLAKRFPGRALFAVGYSLSGNQVAKWLGASDETVPSSLLAAASVSPPFDLNQTSRNIDTAFLGIYKRHFLRTLLPKARGKARKHPGALDSRAIKRIRTLYEFDDAVTARLHGFEGAQDYYQRVAWPQFAAGVKRPLLVLAAEDDPFSPASTIPDSLNALSSWIHPLVVPKGGHVGFVGGSLSSPQYWSEAQLFRFFDFYLRRRTISSCVRR